MNKDRKLDYLEFPASDFDKIKSFYQSVFDWKFTDYGPDYCAFNDGRLDGGFYKSPKQSRVDSGAVLVVLYAEDLQAVRQEVLDAGGKICVDIFDFPGGRRFQFQDPHGNELAVWSDQGDPAEPGAN